MSLYRRDVAPQLPAAFWETEPMSAALASGDLGRIIRAYRFHPLHGDPLPQDLVAGWLHISQSSLSRIEQGKRRVTIDDLTGFARELGIPMALRWTPRDTCDAGDVEPFEPLDMVRRIERSELGPGTLDARHAGAERLCCAYSTMAPLALRQETEQQLHYVRRLLDGGKTFSQHRELLVIAGWLSLLLGCLHNDMGKRRPAEAARDAARHLGKEAGHPVIVRWACELHCWFALTDGRFRDVTRFAHAGVAASSGNPDSASVQLALQAAKGWAKLGDGREAESALQHGLSLLNKLPRSAHPEHHFVFDPSKYEFYAAPIYEWLGEHERAEEHCDEVFAQCTGRDGTTAWPMRLAETQNTMALVQLHRGDLGGAIDYGNRALDYDRKCLPSLLSATSDIVARLERQHPREPAVHDFRERAVELYREYGYQPPTTA
jgi:transcriptional regulator with XRE-family HTH domain